MKAHFFLSLSQLVVIVCEGGAACLHGHSKTCSGNGKMFLPQGRPPRCGWARFPLIGKASLYVYWFLASKTGLSGARAALSRQTTKLPSSNGSHRPGRCQFVVEQVRQVSGMEAVVEQLSNQKITSLSSCPSSLRRNIVPMSCLFLFLKITVVLLVGDSLVLPILILNGRNRNQTKEMMLFRSTLL